MALIMLAMAEDETHDGVVGEGLTENLRYRRHVLFRQGDDVCDGVPLVSEAIKCSIGRL